MFFWNWFLLFIALLVGESAIFSITSYFWKIPIAKFENSFKVLFVSDPQIQGFELEPPGFIGYLARWDACRYLKTSFTTTFNKVQPDIVIFLGDLFDEGYIASDEQYNNYKEWFDDIYQLSQHKVQTIFLAGDNDIGGEEKPIEHHLKKRFETFFGPTNQLITVKNWQFLKLNTLPFFYYLNTLENEEFIKELDDFYASSVKEILDENKNIVVLSHLPLMYWDVNFSLEVMENIKPVIFFSGNEHKSIYQVYQSDGKEYYEQLIPTCSYRMGTNDIGMGVAIFETDGSYQYAVLWLPQRFLYLWIYLTIIIITIINYLIQHLCRKSNNT